MGFPVAALGGAGGNYSGVKVNRTVIASQTTPTNIKNGGGNIYGISAMVSGSGPVFVQYFSDGGTTLGVSNPVFEVVIAGSTTNSGIVQTFPVPVPVNATTTKSGIWIAASTAMGTGPAVAASSVTVYTLYA